jgi:hypothetical protein
MNRLETIKDILESGLMLILALFLGFIGGCGMVAVPVAQELNALEKQAVQRGLAEYNPTNGVWQWKEAK